MGGLSRTLEDPDGGGVVVDSPGSPEGGGEDGGRGDEIVGEGVVQVALWLGIESAGPGHEDELGAWAGQAEGIPGARKRPGHRQTPSRSYPELRNQQLIDGDSCGGYLGTGCGGPRRVTSWERS